MELKEFKAKAEQHLDALETLIKSMPQKGDTSEDCQRANLVNALNDLHYSINGTEAEDLVANTHACMECGWEGGFRTRCPICCSEEIEEF